MDELNTRAKLVFELMRKYSDKYNIKTIGSEYLILAMYETEDSLCHFLLNEYEITKEEILAKTEDIFILRKDTGQYNSSIQTILKQAKLLASNSKVGEEHLFMAVLMSRGCIACQILESLGLDIDDLILDVKEIYDFDNNTDELAYVRNISKLAKNNELASFVNRNEYLSRLDVILHRKYKNNPLLIGNAGVGKTAIVEGYALKMAKEKSDMSILSLNLTSMLAGTRYRGDFEERFDKFVKEIATKKNVIIFIDEIHTIMGSQTTEGNLDVANMLKPFLARSDIKLIGATTIEEFHKSIEKDKALCRRFQPLFISEPSLKETKEILFGIKQDYISFHQVNINDNVLDYLIEESNKHISKKYRPDKCIDVLDDVLALAKINKKKEVNLNDVDNVIFSFLGSNEKNQEVDFEFAELAKYKWLFENRLLTEKPILKLKYLGDKTGLNALITDCKNIFSLGEENVLNVDLDGYKEPFTLSSLIGSPPGYVGYEDEGILSKHILAYPISILVFKNFDNGNKSIQSFIFNLLKNGFFTDQKGRSIDLENVIIIIEGIKSRRSIGYNEFLDSSDDALFDEVIKNKKDLISNLNDYYIGALSRMNYEISFDFNIDSNNKKHVNSYLYSFTKSHPYGKYIIKHEDIFTD